jgi:hypothetical protein
MPNATPAPRPDRVRIAIVSTPRSGNTWLRGLLSRIYDLTEMAVHSPDEIAWDELPDRCVIQIHWRRVEPFVSQLDAHGFRVVVLARHPLDVFISALNYTQYVHRREDCPGGDDCMSCLILGETPRSEAFLRYTCEWPGELTLAYSRDWWSVSGVAPVRYERLVEDTAGALYQLVADLALEPVRPVAEAVDDYEIERMRVRQEVWHYHYWQGRPGLWKTLIPPAEAKRIAGVHREVFAALGYECDPDESLTDLQADLNWLPLQLASMRRHINDERAKHEATRATLAEARRQVQDQERRLETTHSLLAESDRRLAETHAGLLDTRHALAQAVAERDAWKARVDGLGPTALGVVWRLHRLSRRRPKVLSALRRLARRTPG